MTDRRIADITTKTTSSLQAKLRTWFPVWLLMLLGYVLVVGTALFLFISIWGMKNNSRVSIAVFSAFIGGIWIVLVSVASKRFFQSVPWKAMLVFFVLWALPFSTMITVPYNLPIPHMAIVGSLTWISLRLAYRVKRHAVILLLIVGLIATVLSSAILWKLEEDQSVLDFFYSTRDIDNDGVYDIYDDCPGGYGPVNSRGCSDWTYYD